MFSKYLIIDDIFPEETIDKIRSEAMERVYYPTEKSDNVKYIPGLKVGPVDERPGGAWRGYRSPQGFDKSDYIDHMIAKVFQSSNVKPIDYVAGWSYNFWPEDVHYHPNWWHNDTVCLFTGILYLNKEYPDKTLGGTDLITDLDKKEVFRCEGKYNRLFVYQGHHWHKPQIGFGSTLEDCRLTLNFCVQSLDLRVLRQDGIPEHDGPDVLQRVRKINDEREKSTAMKYYRNLPEFKDDY